MFSLHKTKFSSRFFTAGVTDFSAYFAAEWHKIAKASSNRQTATEEEVNARFSPFTTHPCPFVIRCLLLSICYPSLLLLPICYPSPSPARLLPILATLANLLPVAFSCPFVGRPSPQKVPRKASRPQIHISRTKATNNRHFPQSTRQSHQNQP